MSIEVTIVMGVLTLIGIIGGILAGRRIEKTIQSYEAVRRRNESLKLWSMSPTPAFPSTSIHPSVEVMMIEGGFSITIGAGLKREDEWSVIAASSDIVVRRENHRKGMLLLELEQRQQTYALLLLQLNHATILVEIETSLSANHTRITMQALPRLRQGCRLYQVEDGAQYLRLMVGDFEVVRMAVNSHAMDELARMLQPSLPEMSMRLVMEVERRNIILHAVSAELHAAEASGRRLTLPRTIVTQYCEGDVTLAYEASQAVITGKIDEARQLLGLPERRPTGSHASSNKGKAPS